MIKETKVQKELVEHHKFCDVCGKEISMGLKCTSARCMYCGKDLCENCIGHEDCTPGDYRDIFCKKCWEIGNEYRPVIGELNAKVEALYKEWQDKCKDIDAKIENYEVDN